MIERGGRIGGERVMGTGGRRNAHRMRKSWNEEMLMTSAIAGSRLLPPSPDGHRRFCYCFAPCFAAHSLAADVA